MFRHSGVNGADIHAGQELQLPSELNEDRISQRAKGSADKPPRLASTGALMAVMAAGSWQMSASTVVLLGCRVASLRGPHLRFGDLENAMCD